MNNNQIVDMLQDAEYWVPKLGYISGINATQTSTGPVMEIQLREKPETPFGEDWKECVGPDYGRWTMHYIRLTERVLVWWSVQND